MVFFACYFKFDSLGLLTHADKTYRINFLVHFSLPIEHGNLNAIHSNQIQLCYRPVILESEKKK